MTIITALVQGGVFPMLLQFPVLGSLQVPYFPSDVNAFLTYEVRCRPESRNSNVQSRQEPHGRCGQTYLILNQIRRRVEVEIAAVLHGHYRSFRAWALFYYYLLP